MGADTDRAPMMAELMAAKASSVQRDRTLFDNGEIKTVNIISLPTTLGIVLILSVLKMR